MAKILRALEMLVQSSGVDLQQNMWNDLWDSCKRSFMSLCKVFRPHCGPGVDTAYNRNEYQEYFLGVKAAGA